MTVPRKAPVFAVEKQAEQASALVSLHVASGWGLIQKNYANAQLLKSAVVRKAATALGSLNGKPVAGGTVGGFVCATTANMWGRRISV
jgi:hypothetical protein